MEQEQWDRVLWNASRAAVVLGVIMFIAAAVCGVLLIQHIVES